MRPVSVTYKGMTAEVAGGWVVAGSDDETAAEIAIRLDDGQTAMCLADERISTGDRVYRAVYGGRMLERRVGVEIHDVTADLVQASCRQIAMRTSYVYAGMAVVPALLMIALLAMRAAWGSASISPGVIAVVAISLVIPVAMWLIQSRRTLKDNERRAETLAGCRRLVRGIVEQDVAAWKARLVDAVPGTTPVGQGAFIRGNACRIVEGISSVDDVTATIVRPGRPITIPEEAVSTCGLEDGDLVHALIPAGRIPATPLAVSNPVNGRTWTDDAIVGGPDGTVYRAAMRAALGRAAWNMVTRQWDEIGRRRRDARRA